MTVAQFSDLKIRPYDNVAGISAKVDKVRDTSVQGPLPVELRKELIRNIYYAVYDNQALLEAALKKDLSRSPSETSLLEISGILAEVKAALDNIDQWVKPEKAGFDIKTAASGPHLVKEAYGLVLVIGPWNYPLLCVAAPIISAIAAGNTIVVKPSEVVPHASEALMQVFEQAIPSQYLQVVTGAIPETTELLKQKFDKICFTGSPGVGKIVSRAAAEHLTPCLLELGGKSPVVVDHTADLALAAKRIVWGKFVNAGQTCIAPDYVIVEESVKAKFVEEVKAAVKRSYPNLTKDSPDYAHVVSDRLWDRADSLVKESKGKVELAWGKADKASRFYPPTIVSDVTVSDSLMKDELFGPILPIVTVRSAYEVLPIIRVHDTPLAFYIFSNDKKLIKKLEVVRTGGLLVNDTLLHGASPCLPFGGVGNSGNGAYHGKFGFDAFSHLKPVMKQPGYLELLLNIRYPPYTPKKQKILASSAVPIGVWWPRHGPVRRSIIRRLFSRGWWIIIILVAFYAKSKL